MFFYHDIESRLEIYYKCKVEKPDVFDDFGSLIGERKQMRKTVFFFT